MDQLQDKSILVIDDDQNLRQLIAHTFSRVGAKVYMATNGPEGLRTFFELRPDLVILDIMMPGLDGWEVCRQIRNLSDAPIIMLTSLGSENDVIRGLDGGAIDYVVKPFSPKILMARARAALRHIPPTAYPSPSAPYSDGYLTVDLVERRVLVQGKPVKLSATEYNLFEYLFDHAGRVLTIEQILDHVWGWEYRDSADYVHVYISHLRRKLEEDPKEPRYIFTEHGIGYRFEQRVDG